MSNTSNLTETDTLIIASGEDYNDKVLDYMNKTYGKAFNDEFSIERVSYANISSSTDQFVFKSKNINKLITLNIEPESRKISCDYLAHTYNETIEDEIKEICSKKVTSFIILLDGTANNTNYASSINEYKSKERFRLEIALSSDSDYNNPESQDELARYIYDEVKKTSLNIYMLSLYFAKELKPKESVRLIDKDLAITNFTTYIVNDGSLSAGNRH